MPSAAAQARNSLMTSDRLDVVGSAFCPGMTALKAGIDASDATLFGATNGATPAHLHLRWGRKTFANVRPVRWRPGFDSPLRRPQAIARGSALDQQVVPAMPLGLTTDLLRRRPDIRQAEQQMVRANAEVGVAVANFYPRIGLSALFGGVPMCHGAGGMAGHVQFGARTSGALVILGVILLV